jgi:hypothetical protein
MPVWMKEITPAFGEPVINAAQIVGCGANQGDQLVGPNRGPG